MGILDSLFGSRPTQPGLGMAQAQPSMPQPPVANAPISFQEPPLAPQFGDNPAGSIGFVLQSLAAGLQGQEQPIDRLKRQREADRAIRMQQAAFAFEVADKLRRVPEAQRASVLSGMQPLLEQSGIPIDALGGLTGRDDQSYGYLKQLYSSDPDLFESAWELGGGVPEEVMKLLDSETFQNAFTRRADERFMAEVGPGGADPGSTFEKAYDFTIRQEGGDTSFVADDAGRGPNYGGYVESMHPGVSAMTPEERKAYGKKTFWDPLGLDSLDPTAAMIAFDAAFNQGPDYARGLLERTGGDPEKMLKDRELRYATTAESPNYAQYLPTWNKRIADLRGEVGGIQEAGSPTAGFTAAEWAYIDAAPAGKKRDAYQDVMKARMEAEGEVTTPKTSQVINLVYPDGRRVSFDATTQQNEIRAALAAGANEDNRNGVTVNVGSDKAFTQYMTDELKRGGEAAQNARGIIAKLGVARQATEQYAKTGTLGDFRLGLEKAARALGLKSDAPAGEVIKSVQTQLAVLQRIPGSGATTDFEMDLYLRSVPGLNTTPEGNLALIAIGEKLAKRTLEDWDRYRAYVQQKGNDVGFQFNDKPVLTEAEAQLLFGMDPIGNADPGGIERKYELEPIP